MPPSVRLRSASAHADASEGMVADLRVAVSEEGMGLTHQLALACRDAHIAVLGQIAHLDRVVVPTRAAAVVIVEHTRLIDAPARRHRRTSRPDARGDRHPRSGDDRTAALMELPAIARSADQRTDRMRTLTLRERGPGLLVDGRSTPEIAGALSIWRAHRVEHVKNILAKLGVRSKVEAMRYGWGAGALDMPMAA